MTVATITRNWADYDRKKAAQQKDADWFDYTSAWEVDYLARKLKGIYTFIPDELIREAIHICGLRQTTPDTRASFTEAVLKRLGIPL